jgi:hypothetical protein
LTLDRDVADSGYLNPYQPLSANWTFSVWCVPLIKSGSLNWLWSTKTLGQFATCISVNQTSCQVRIHRKYFSVRSKGKCITDKELYM